MHAHAIVADLPTLRHTRYTTKARSILPQSIVSIITTAIYETTNRAIVLQAHKFLSVRPERAERVRAAENPRAAQAEATRMRKLQRSDWLDVNVDIMEKVLQAKFTQHPELRTKLLATRHAELVEGSTVSIARPS